MKKTFVVVAVASLLLAPTAVRAEDPTHEARVAAAKAYLKAVPAEKLVDQILDGLTKDVRLKLSAKEAESIKSSLDLAEMNSVMLDALVKDFTPEELKQMAQFFGSASGQSIVRKMPSYMAKILPSVQQPINKQVAAIMEKKHQHPKVAPEQAAPQQQPQESAAPVAAPQQQQKTAAPAAAAPQTEDRKIK